MKNNRHTICHSRMSLSGISSVFNTRRDPRLQISGMTRSLGFTLIELLVVVLIIGILSAIALPQYQKAVEKSRAVQALLLLKHLSQAENLFYIENGNYTNDFELLISKIPFSENTKWINDQKFQARSSKEWSVMLQNEYNDAIGILVGRLGGMYDKKVGLAYYYTHNDTNVPRKQMLCMELPALSNPGKYCNKILGASHIYSTTGGTRLYLLPN